MRWIGVLAVLVVLGCGDDDAGPTIDAAVFDATATPPDAATSADAAAGVDASIDRDAHSADCLPSGECGGPACGDRCCATGERCVAGECLCGGSDACGVGDVCTSGPQPKDGCGSVCCGASGPCPALAP